MGAVIFFVCLSLISAVDGYENEWDGPLNFKCPAAETFLRIYSEHSNKYEDRRFGFLCKAFPIITTKFPHCTFSDNYENEFDEAVGFACPNNGYLNGMTSVHDNDKEDRRWKFNCCYMPGVHLFDCEITQWTNNWDGWQDYYVPEDKVIKGVVSVHDNDKEDRRFKYMICNAKKF